MFPCTSVSKLALLSASARINYEGVVSATDAREKNKKQASRALSASGKEQRKCDASSCGAYVLQLARYRIQRPVYERECADFRAGRVSALFQKFF